MDGLARRLKSEKRRQAAALHREALQIGVVKEIRIVKAWAEKKYEDRR